MQNDSLYSFIIYLCYVYYRLIINNKIIQPIRYDFWGRKWPGHWESFYLEAFGDRLIHGDIVKHKF